MVSCCVELLAVELVMLFGEIVIKKREIRQNDQWGCEIPPRDQFANWLLCQVEIHVHENSQIFLSSVADSHSNRDKHTNFKTILYRYRIYVGLTTLQR